MMTPTPQATGAGDIETVAYQHHTNGDVITKRSKLSGQNTGAYNIPLVRKSDLRATLAQPSAETVQVPGKAELGAWLNSLAKGEKLCRENGHRGDAETLADIARYLAAQPSAKPVAARILEALSWFGHERDDLTLEEAVEAFGYDCPNCGADNRP